MFSILSLSARGSASSQASPRGLNRVAELDGHAATGFSWLKDTDPATTSFTAGVAATGSRSRRTSHGVTPFPPTGMNDQDFHERQSGESCQVSAADRRYPGGRAIAFSAAAVASGTEDQDWSGQSSESSDIEPNGVLRLAAQSRSERWSYSSALSLNAGMGVGHVRNATGVYEAQVLERRLLESGALTRPLSSTARRRLIDLMYLRHGFSSVHERSNKTLWQAVERIAQEDGALGKGIDPYSVGRAAEPIFGAGSGVAFADSPLLRSRGAYSGLFLQNSHARSTERNDMTQFFTESIDDSVFFSSSGSEFDRFRSTVDRVSAGAESEYHLPLGPRWQIDASARAALPLDHRDVSMEVTGSASIGWIVADRWIASANVSDHWFDAARTRGPSLGDSGTWVFGASVAYYLEDRLLLRLDATEDQTSRLSDTGAESTHNGKVLLGLTYRLRGTFDAPGLDIQ